MRPLQSLYATTSPPGIRAGTILFIRSEQGGGVGVGKTLGIGNGLEGQMAVVGVQTLHQSGVGLAGGLGAQLRDLQSVGQGGAGEGKGCRTGTRPEAETVRNDSFPRIAFN